MWRWIKRRLDAFIGPYVERQIAKEIESGDYEIALRHSSYLCQRQEKALQFQHLRTLALLGLERFAEAVAVADRVSRLIDDKSVKLADEGAGEWLALFAHVKCRALYGLKEYHSLGRFSSVFNRRFPNVVPVECYEILAAIHLGTVEQAMTCVEALDGSIDRFDREWHFLVLYSAYRYLGDQERAGNVARRGLEKYPDHPGVRQMKTGEHIENQYLGPCTPTPSRPACRRRHHF